MTSTDADRLSEALRSAALPEGLGVPTSKVLLRAQHARRRRAATRAAATFVSVSGLAAAGVWGGAFLAPPQENVSPADEVVQESVTYPDVRVEDIYDMTREEQLAGLAESMGLENPPVVEVIREVTPEESETVIPQCLTERGWVAEDRIYTIRTEQQRAFDLDRYRCLAAYPVNPGPDPRD
jgi:hypothetical protein